MTDPQTPGDALRASAQRLVAQRESARELSQRIADERKEQAEKPISKEGEQ